MLEFLVKLVESGRLPDVVTRAGMRSLLRQRLREEALTADREAFVAACRAGPIARLPEKANEQHYEVPHEFFRLVLGPHRKYSCCDWSEGVTSLCQAEESALSLICSRAEIVDGMQVLDLGCGWGSLTLWLLQHFPHTEVTAVSNSHSQRQWIERQAAQRGYTDRLTLVTDDINQFQPAGPFDRVVSIEMFEHVTNHEKLLRRISHWLRPAGKLFVHIFCHKSTPYFFESRGPGDWMAEHFFSGGMMPSEQLLSEYADDLQVSRQWRINGKHYERTSNAWLANLTANSAETMPILRQTYGDNQAHQWYHRWRIFLMACAELFGFRGGEEWFVAHYLFEPVPKPQVVSCEA